MHSILRRSSLLALALWLFAGAASAQTTSIAAFFGTWEGNALSESDISVNFKLTSRDIGVTIEPSGGGFTLSWNTVQRQRGDPSNPKEQLKATKLTFNPVRAGVWQSTQNGDPVSGGEPYAWAYIDDQSLVVNILQVYPDGHHEIQVYRRTLTGGLMELVFNRIVDGKHVRSAKGRLIKVSN